MEEQIMKDQTQVHPEPHRKFHWKRWMCVLLLSPVFLFLLLTFLFYLPPVQDWLVGYATECISHETGKKVSIGSLRITPLFDVELSKLLVLNTGQVTDRKLQVYREDGRNHLHGDTLVYAKYCILDLDLGSLLSGKVDVDALDLRKACVDTQDMLDEMVLSGKLGRFELDVHDVDLNQKKVCISHARMEGCDLDIFMRDTLVVKEDTPSDTIPWMLRFNKVGLHRSNLAFHTQRDSMEVHADLYDVQFDKGWYDLENQALGIENFTAYLPLVSYDQNFLPRVDGLDYNHLSINELRTRLDKLNYELGSGHLTTQLAQMKGRERCGIEIDNLSATVDLDTTQVSLRDVLLTTPTSCIHGEADVEWLALEPHQNGKMEALLFVDLSKQDVMSLIGQNLPSSVTSNYPDKMLNAELQLTGNVDAIKLKKLSLKMPGMMNVSLVGEASNLMDSTLLAADIRWDAQTWDMTLVQKAFELTGFNIPALTASGDLSIHNQECVVNAGMQQAAGTLNLNGRYHMAKEYYEAHLDMHQFIVSNFVPLDSVVQVTAKSDVLGRGLDFLSPRSDMHALVDVDKMNLGSRDFSLVHLDALLQQGHGMINFVSANEILDADGCFEVKIGERKVEDAIFSIDMRGVDLYSLGVVEQPLNVSMALHMNGHTDLKENHWVRGNVNAIMLQTADTTYYPKDISAELLMHPDTLYAYLSAGDLELSANSHQGWLQVLECIGNYSTELNHQIEEKVFDKTRLRHQLPELDLCIASGRENPLANFVSTMGYTYQNVDIDIHADTLSGLNGHGWIHTINTGAMVLDTLQFNVSQDERGMELFGRVCNGKRNPDISFDARMKASLTPSEAVFSLEYLDDKGQKGVDIGARAFFHNGNVRLHLEPLRPVLAYRYFTLNEDNYLRIDSVGHVEADLDLLADDGTGLKIFSTPNETAEQDITVSINRLNLGELCSVIPYVPQITGYLQGDYHLLQTDGIISVGTDMHVKDMTYEGCPMGLVGINAAYMPNEDGSHYVDGFLTQNDSEVLSFTGLYQSFETTDNLEADVNLQRFPLEIVNGFLGEMVQLKGNAYGEIEVHGPTSKPIVNGGLLTEGMHLMSSTYSVDLRVADDTISVRNNRLDFSRLTAYSTGTRPLQMGGYVDFADLNKIRLDISATARNFELINAPKSKKAEAYGKMFVDINLFVRGLLNDLSVTGNLAVLGNSNLTYVLKDSPITVEDEMADLVTFVDFGDTLVADEPDVESPSNLSMRLNVSIDPTAQVHCLLSEDGVSYANIEGGGDLTLTYDERSGLQLFGRYTINQGKMNYTLMIVTLKDCEIASGSYVEFSGDPFNPRLNISASEHLNTTITENQTPRMVGFDVGLTISQTLSNMGLEFTLASPEDINVQNEIAQMTAEQRGKVAVTLMATGMYILDGKSTGGFNTTNALNSFLNSQISQIAGKALNSIDLSLGVQNSNTSSGHITTDYSFRFAKRFWGNRISLIIGGKVSSGSEAVNTGQSIIDNVSIEYRLDKSASRYVTVFYDNNNESILEGNVAEMGAGLVLRRKTNHLGELFIFNRSREKKSNTKRKKEDVR